ncbi:MAG TPA: type IV pilus secretin PilQ [Burkholderiales bacterium]|nr:type IV pilus secretin PilQ [Burkholderiales bacterium]
MKNYRTPFITVLVAAAAWLWAGIALAQSAPPNSIEALNVASQGGRVIVRITTKQPLTAAPASFTVNQPARIAFDFPGTGNALGRNNQDINEGELRSMSMVQVGDRTRMVLNLRNMVTYESQVEGNVLSVVLTPVPVAEARSKTRAAERFAEGTTDAKHNIREIDFRRGKAGEGRIVVDLGDTSTGIDIRQQGQQLIVDFLKTQLPENLRKRLDVQDFATPVSTVSTFTQGENVRMVIEPKGLWEHNAYQTDTQFVIEVKPVQYDPNKLVQGTRGGYRGDKLSLNFQNVDVRSVLNVIADFTDLNIITSDTVGGNLTLRLKDVPWDQALEIIMQTRGLDMRKNGNVIWIAPRDELATKEKLELEAAQQISDLEPLRQETFQLNYTKASEMVILLRGGVSSGGAGGTNIPIISKRGSVVADPRTNILFVQDIPSRLEAVRKMIATSDIPVRQVMIEARIVEATDKFSRTLGVRLGYNNIAGNQFFGGRPLFNVGGGVTSPVSTATGLANVNAATNTSMLTNPIPSFPQANMINLPATPTETGAQAGQFSLVLFNSAATKFLNLEITALESDGKGKVISSPRVVTANQVEALIEQGTELPYQQATSSGATSVAFRKATLALRVKPQITPDGNVIMDVDINKDAVGIQTTAGFAIDTKHVRTSVLVENGGTVVIGGIYTQDERNQVNKVPFFGDLPAVGPLFRNTLRVDNKTELLVFLTPRIIDERLSVR